MAISLLLSSHADLTVAGWRVLRSTWKRLQDEPRAVAAQLKRMLDA